MMWVQDTTIAFGAEAEEKRIPIIPILGGALFILILLSKKNGGKYAI